MSLKNMVKSLVVLCGGLVLVSCVTTGPSVDFGVQPGQSSHIPARIAVMPCLTWPSGARFESLPLTNLSKENIEKFCSKMDEVVLKGFDKQPYMKGYSPKAVGQLLVESNNGMILDKLPHIWRHFPEDCSGCGNGPSFYVASIQSRGEWRSWLNDLSRSVRNADAVLLPFIMFANESTFNDRGVIVMQKAAGVLMLLVDTNNGLLIWAGGRNGEINNQRFESADVNKSIEPPKWEDLYERVFTSALWKDFPGRQEY